MTAIPSVSRFPMTILTVGLSFCLIVAFAACGKKDTGPEGPMVRPVKTYVVGASASGGKRTFPGTVQAAHHVVLGFEVPGKLVKLPIKEGQKVKKGELLARLDQTDFNAAAAAAKAKTQKANADLERNQQLFTKDGISATDLEMSETTYKVAKANRAKAYQAVRNSSIKAPFSGVIGKRYVENFQNINAKEPIVLLQDLSAYEILVNIPEGYLVNIKKSEEHKAVASFDSMPGKEFEVTVKEFGTEADPVTRTYPVTLDLPTIEGVRILPGMSARVTHTIITETTEGSAVTFVVPVTAVVSDPAGKSLAWILDPKTMAVSARQVEVGQLTGSSIEVISGLIDGDEIVTAGVTELQEGMKVRRLKKKAGGL